LILDSRSHTGLSPSLTSCSKELTPQIKYPWMTIQKLQFKERWLSWILNLSFARFTRRY